jgi:HK97 family phage portal protein
MAIIANINVFPPTRAGYQLYYGQMWSFDTKEILHDKYFNPQWGVTGGQLYGQSPLRAAAKNLTRSNEAKTAAVASFQNGGPAGVLFMNDERFDPTNGQAQAQALKTAVSQKGGSANFNSIAVSGYKVDWKQIGLSPVELNIIESEKWDLKALCNIYGVPSQLLNDSDSKTYNNQREGEKALTLRCAIPLLNSLTENLNRKLHSDWGYKGTNLYVDYDLSVYGELEANKSEQTDWLDKAWWISPKQKLDIMNIEVPDYIPTEELEKLYIPTGLQTIDQFQPLNIPDNLNP